MIIIFKEIYKNETFRHHAQERKRYGVREIVINLEHIVCIRPNTDMNSRLSEGLIAGAPPNASFCTISLNRGQSGTDIVVVGTLEELNKKIKERKVLHG